MADSTTPFTNDEWNQIIQDINDLATGCADVDPLDEVEECHRLSKTDITDVQDKLVELCEDNVFTPPDMKWLQSTIQEIEDAIEAGDCCCEETNWNPTRKLFHIDYFVRHTNLDGGLTSITVDWAGWMGQDDEVLDIEEVECPGENPEDPPTTIEVRSGGRYWVGTQYKTWELYIFMGDGSAPSTAAGGPLRLSGIVKDGYMVVPPSAGGTNPTCSSPATGAFDLGEKDPAFGWPYEVCAGTETTETVCSTVNSYENEITLNFDNGGFEYPDGQMTPTNGGDTWWTFTAEDYYIPNPGFEQSGFFDLFIRDIQGRVVLKC